MEVVLFLNLKGDWILVSVWFGAEIMEMLFIVLPPGFLLSKQFAETRFNLVAGLYGCARFMST